MERKEKQNHRTLKGEKGGKSMMNVDEPRAEWEPTIFLSTQN
jgi:hypothetical protein